MAARLANAAFFAALAALAFSTSFFFSSARAFLAVFAPEIINQNLNNNLKNMDRPRTHAHRRIKVCE